MSGKLKVKCPKCVDRKGGTKGKDLSINYDKGLYKCHSASCGWAGSVTSLKTTFSRPTWENKTDLPDRILKRFEKRGITSATLNKMKISVGDKGGLQFNYFRNGELINVKTRWQKDGQKYFRQHAGAEKILYNVDSLRGKKKAIIVEGEMDVLSWIEAGVKDYGVVSIDQGAGMPGSSLDGKLECFKNCALELDSIEEFYLCLDKDAPGTWTQEEIIRRLGEYRCFIIDLPDGKKDSNEVIDDSNPQSLSARLETLRLCLKNARPVPIPGIIELDSSLEETMLQEFRNGLKTGETTHFPELDKRFTFYPGDISLFIGFPNHGKGQVIRQLMAVKAKFDGWKWAVFAPEDVPPQDFFNEIIQSYIGKSPYKDKANQMSEQEYIEGLAFVKLHFFLINPPTVKKGGKVHLPSNEWINKRITFLKLKEGVNAYVKDPWNKIAHEFDGREDLYLAKAISSEKMFAGGFDAGIYVAHPKSPVLEKGKLRCPNQYNISGGAMFNNMFDNVIAVHRPNIIENPEDKLTEWHSQKIKKQKRVGRPGKCELYFEYHENRYYQYVDSFCPLTRQAKSNIADNEFDELAGTFRALDNTDLNAMRNDDEIPF